MSDPRNIAHDKKVTQEKQHQNGKVAAAEERGSESEMPEVAPTDNAPGELEKSVAVLSKLKEMEFHSRANIETLAGLSLMMEDELKQNEFSQPIAEIYSAQDAFQTKIAALVQSYGTKCESLKPSA